MQNLHYTYDPVGNITHIQDDAQQTIWFANQQVEPSSDFVYDALYRLIEATGRENAAAIGAPPHAEGTLAHRSVPVGRRRLRNYTQRYRYDSVGNFLSVSHVAASFPGRPAGGWTREYDYAFSDPNQPASNRLWQTWLGGDRTQAVTYRHDDHGNMLNLDRTAPGLDIRWDWRDMIRALDLGGGGDAFYNYGIDKQRTRKLLQRNGGGSEDRIYLGGYELYRRERRGGRRRRGDRIRTTCSRASSGSCWSTTSSSRAQPPSPARTVCASASRRCSVTSTATTSARSASSSTRTRT